MSLPDLHTLSLRHKASDFPLSLGGAVFSDTLGNRAFLALWMVIRGRHSQQDPLSVCLEDNHHPRENAREAIYHLRQFYHA